MACWISSVSSLVNFPSVVWFSLLLVVAAAAAGFGIVKMVV